MTLVKRNFNNWNDLFDDFFGGIIANASNEMNMPPVNIHETNNAFQIDVVAPGLQKQDFKLNIKDKILTISYEKVNESEDKNEKMHRQEYNFKSFKRSFTVDEGIDANAVSAKYENGILQITLPKKEEVKLQPKEISIL
jgi:HSP20 family protein